MEIRRGHLSDYFEGVGVKRLSKVDATPDKSNQHEVGTTKKMRDDFLGYEKTRFNAVYVWLGEEQDGFSIDLWATYYDTREKDEKRSPEWRLYYPGSIVTESMSEGDTLFLAKHVDGPLLFIITPQGSTSEQQLFWLFGIQPKEGTAFNYREVSDKEPGLDFTARFILEEIGIEFEDPDANKLDTIIDRFGLTFPKTVEMSKLARLTMSEVRAEDDPDVALVAWLDQEEAMFRRLERRIVSERLREGFMDGDTTDVDGFLQFSLSVQNRRKSRMGHSLEHHLGAVFEAWDVQHDRGKFTENRHKPDFLFPNVEAYHAAPAEGLPGLMMLGSKSSCKDRWRQVLAEAAKIQRKHLLTLEPGISEPQTDQMKASALQLVVPAPLHGSYTTDQQAWLWSLSDFIGEVSQHQRS